ncbi:MAG: MFS transporter [Clostridia bacterium]|nr:MFS transporter [Clostridia bacterium]
MTRNKIFFGLGTIGRDALYSLVSMYLMVHLTDVVTFSDAGLGAIGIMLTLFGIFDAVIDPFVGAIVDNTKTRWGKFKPWILIGMIGTGILTALMFHDFKMSETWHIVLLGVTYLLFSIFFSLNDIAYWSLMPAISKDQKVREGVGSFARICANIGMFAMVLVYPSMSDVFRGMGFEGSLRTPFFVFAIIAALVMWVFQTFTLLGVKEDRTQLQTVERTSLKDLFRALFKNDQLLVAAISMALFMIGYCTTTAFGTYYFDYAYGDGSVYMVFAAVLAVAQLSALMLFPLFRKRFTRRQLYTGSTIAVTLAYVLFFLSFEWLPMIVVAGLILFFAQAFIQLLMLLFLADSIEYGEWKLGKRNEAASFAVQPFVNQIGGAISRGILALTLIVSGINAAIKSAADESELTGTLVAPVIEDWSVWVMKISMMIFPLICIVVGFILYYKKFRIDEETYAGICAELEERRGGIETIADEVDITGTQSEADAQTTVAQETAQYQESADEGAEDAPEGEA